MLKNLEVAPLGQTLDLPGTNSGLWASVCPAVEWGIVRVETLYIPGVGTISTGLKELVILKHSCLDCDRGEVAVTGAVINHIISQEELFCPDRRTSVWEKAIFKKRIP